MTPRAFLALAVATGVSVIAAGVIVAVQDTGPTRAPGGDLMFKDLNDRINDLAEVVIDTPIYRIDLARHDDSWVDAGRGDYPVQSDAVSGVMGAMAPMITVEPKTSNPDWYQYVNVVDPAEATEGAGVRITATAANGDTLADAIIGSTSESIGLAPLGGMFVRPVAAAETWLVEGTLRVPGALNEWFGNIVHVPGPDVARVAILIGGEVVYDAEKVNVDAGDYDLTYLSEDLGPADSTANDNAVRSFTQGVTSVTLEDVRSREGVTIADDARTVRYGTRNGMQIDMTLGSVDDETWVVVDVTATEPDAADAAAEIQARTENWAFKLPAHKLAVLERDIDTLFDLPGAANEQPPGPPPGQFIFPGQNGQLPLPPPGGGTPIPVIPPPPGLEPQPAPSPAEPQPAPSPAESQPAPSAVEPPPAEPQPAPSP